MTAFTVEDTLNQANSLPENLLAEQLIEFANEAFVFSNVSRGSPALAADPAPARNPALTPAYFSDVVPPPLPDRYLRNARVVSVREQILTLLPKGGTCVEVAPHSGEFSRQILSLLHPAQLHLCDRDFNSFDDSPFGDALERGTVALHEGEAAEYLATQPDRHFDLICFHFQQSYAAAARALEQAGRKIKEDGSILCVNYTMYSPLEGVKYGVARAVNEFCRTKGFEISCLALNSMGYQDVVLRRSNGPVEPAPSGGPFLDAPDTHTFLPDVWEYLIDKYEIQSVLDIGAGAGWSTKWFADRNIYALGVEGCAEALAKSQCRSNIIEHDYRTGPFVPAMELDLGWCAGFVEQIEERFMGNFMASFRACHHVCLTHAEAGELNAENVNAQPTAYWIKKMDEYGFDYDAAETARLRSTDKHKAPRGRRTLTFFNRRR